MEAALNKLRLQSIEQEKKMDELLQKAIAAKQTQVTSYTLFGFSLRLRSGATLWKQRWMQEEPDGDNDDASSLSSSTVSDNTPGNYKGRCKMAVKFVGPPFVACFSGVDKYSGPPIFAVANPTVEPPTTSTYPVCITVALNLN